MKVLGPSTRLRRGRGAEMGHDLPDASAGQLLLPLRAAMTSSQPAGGARNTALLAADPRVRLQAWQKRLEEHFAPLATLRRDADWPVFALEHGLGLGEREALLRDVRECAGWGPGRDVPLPWVVYAAEVGYEYSGYEYWQTFESKTPGWQSSRQWRERIRDRFERFAEAFHGAQPDGDWAHQFNIIAWPITHGVLPRDLQRQLAALLYDASTSFRAETFASAEALGRRLQGRCAGYSARFRQFAENARLLGQIALALLLQDVLDGGGGGAGTMLHTGTLARIVEDLNRERDAQQWLADARAAARFRVRGLSRIPLRGRSADAPSSGGRTHEIHEGTESLPRPRFVLREERSDQWQVRLLLPNLAHLAGQSPRTRDVLTRAQGRVAGATVPILATSRIIREAAPKVVLSSWPAPHTQLLTFDGAPPELNAVLGASFRMGTGEQWLFAIGSDGEARELSTRVLRAGASYLFLQKSETRNPASGLGLRTVRMTCAGIYGLRIDVPEHVTDELMDVLGILGLEIAQTLEVWPAGLPAAQWTGDGRVEYVVGQPIILGIRTDHHLARLTITTDEVRRTEVAVSMDVSPGAPLFIRLPSLSPGVHRIAVMAQVASSSAEDEASGAARGDVRAGLQGELCCVIREPRTVAAGQAGALSFAILPTVPSLEEVWEDRVEIHAAVAGGTSIKCRVTLRGTDGRQLFERSLPLPSPCDAQTWRREFAAIRKSAEAHYDEAQVCVLEFDAGALGRSRIVADRDFTPLRWIVRGNGQRAVLVDSQGCSDLTVYVAPCAVPSLEQALEATVALDGFAVRDGGALVVARSGSLEAATVVVPPQRVTSFGALAGERPEVPTPNRDVGSIVGLVRTAALWQRARLTGSSLAAVRRADVVEVLVARITGVIAGGRWVEAEDVLREQGERAAVDLMRGLVAHRPDERAVPVMIAERVAPHLNARVAQAERALLDALMPFVRVHNLETLAPFALRLAASPGEARRFADEVGGEDGASNSGERNLIEGLLGCPVVLRAARYFVVATRALAGTNERERRPMPWEE